VDRNEGKLGSDPVPGSSRPATDTLSELPLRLFFTLSLRNGLQVMLAALRPPIGACTTPSIRPPPLPLFTAAASPPATEQVEEPWPPWPWWSPCDSEAEAKGATAARPASTPTPTMPNLVITLFSWGARKSRRLEASPTSTAPVQKR
jgi:hypothetical protein